ALPRPGTSASSTAWAPPPTPPARRLRGPSWRSDGSSASAVPGNCLGYAAKVTGEGIPAATWSQPGDGERLWFLGTLATIKVPGEASDGRFALIEFLLPHHASPPLHTHPQDESYIVLEGRMIVVAGERRFELEAGAAAVVPRVCRTRSGWNPAQRVCSCSALRRASSASFVTLLCRRSSRCSR